MGEKVYPTNIHSKEDIKPTPLFPVLEMLMQKDSPKFKDSLSCMPDTKPASDIHSKMLSLKKKKNEIAKSR